MLCVNLIVKTSPEIHHCSAFSITHCLQTLIFQVMLNITKTNLWKLWAVYTCKELSLAHSFAKPKRGPNRWIFPKGKLGTSLINSWDAGYLRKVIRGMHYLETFPATHTSWWLRKPRRHTPSNVAYINGTFLHCQAESHDSHKEKEESSLGVCWWISSRTSEVIPGLLGCWELLGLVMVLLRLNQNHPPCVVEHIT